MPKYNIKMAIEDKLEESNPANLEEFIKDKFTEEGIEILNISIEEVK